MSICSSLLLSTSHHDFDVFKPLSFILIGTVMKFVSLKQHLENYIELMESPSCGD